MNVKQKMQDKRSVQGSQVVSSEKCLLFQKRGN